MDKVLIFFVLTSYAISRPADGRIYFEGQNNSDKVTAAPQAVQVPNGVAALPQRYGVPSSQGFVLQHVNKTPVVPQPPKYESQNQGRPEVNKAPVVHQAYGEVPSVGYAPLPVQQANQTPVVPYPQYEKLPPNPQGPNFETKVDQVVPLEPTAQQILEAKAQKVISQGVTRLTLQLQKILANGVDNLIFAPVSIASALALVLLGAKGNTADEIARLLGVFTGVELSSRKELIHQQLGKFFNALETGSEHILGEQLTFASGVFVQDGLPINSEYDHIARNIYRSEVIHVDFRNNGQKSQDLINHWVENRTQGHITSLLKTPLSPATKAVIANAIFFNGEWEHPFLNQTRLRNFFITPNHPVETLMMINSAKVPHLIDNVRHFKMVGMPYKGGDLLMYVVVPDGDLDLFLNTLTPEDVDNMIHRAVNDTVIYLVPKLEIDCRTDLRPALQKLGIRDMFDPVRADLSNLSPGVFATDVVHKVEIKVTETGTSAAAATAVTMERISVPIVAANKPFLFFIYHKPTQSITFWGSVHQPINPEG